VALPSLVLGWGHALAQLRTSRWGMGIVLALGTYAVVVNVLAADLWPHFDLTNVEQPVAEVLLPLWERGREPYDLVRAWTGRSGLGLAVAGSVVGAWIVLARVAEGGIRMSVALVSGAALGLLLVRATTLVEPHPRGARNLEYIERIWEPTAAGDGRSFALPRALGAPLAAPSRESSRTDRRRRPTSP
jgi:hypothetical protein